MEHSSTDLLARRQLNSLPRRGVGQALGHIGALLDAEALQYCVLHGWRSTRGSSEVDIVIAPSDVPQLEERLRGGAGGQVVQLVEYESGCYCFVLAVRTPEGVRLMALDVASDFRQDGCVFLAAQDLLRRRWRTDGVWVAAPETEFAYLLVKKILKRALPDHQKTRLSALSVTLAGEAHAIARQLLGTRWGSAAMQWLSHAEWASFEVHLARLRRVLIWQTVRRDPRTPVRYWYAELRRWWRRWVHPTGLYIAVSGQDAAQRRAFIDHLSAEIGGVFRCTHTWLTNTIATLWQIRPRLVRTALVILDCHGDHGGTGTWSHRTRGLMRLAHRLAGWPDLHFVLGDPAVPVATRQEAAPNGVRQPGAGSPTAVTFPSAWVLDGSLPAETVARNARDVVLDYLHRRYMHQRSFWFPHSRADTLGWLTATLCPSQHAARFVLSRERHRTPDPVHNSDLTFGWITVKSGRGYLIPLTSRRAAVRSLDLYNAKSLKARLAKRILGMGLQIGIGSLFLRRVHLTVRHDSVAEGRGHAALLEYLRSVLGRDDMVVAVSLGTPGPHRKPVLLALTREGTTLAYVKVGSNEATNGLVQREVHILRSLAAGSFQSFAAPRVLHAGWWNGRYVCVQSPPVAGPATRASERLTSRHLNILKELATFRMDRVRLRESDFWKQLQRQAQQVTNSCYRAPLEQGLRGVAQALDGAALPFHLAHGDFAPWDMKVFEDKIVVFDWAHAREAASPAWDLFHFMFETLRARRCTSGEMCAAFLHDRRFGAGVEDYLASVDTGVPWQLLLSLYLLSRLASRAVDTPGHTPRFLELHAVVQLLNMFWSP